MAEVFTVTGDKGGKTAAAPMAVARPVATMDEAALETMTGGAGLADMLSAFLAHERCGVHLYRTVATKTLDDGHRAKFEEFLEQTKEHVDILESLVSDLGGDPMYVSPSARLVEAVDTKLLEPFMLSGGLDATTVELACLEAVMLAERKCHANWQLLSKLAGTLSDKKANKAIQAAVDQVEHQEDEHVAWVESAWERTMLSQVQ